jgi:hypothetical protein
MVFEEPVNQLDIFNLVFVNVNLDGLELIVKHQNLRKYYKVLYVDLIVHLCELIVVGYVHGSNVQRAGLNIPGKQT